MQNKETTIEKKCLEFLVLKNAPRIQGSRAGNTGNQNRFLISGSKAWDASGVNFGQTTMFNVTWVYNDVREGKSNCKFGTIRFLKRVFPDTVTKEFWIVDQLNNLRSIDAGEDDAEFYIKKYLENTVIDPNTLMKTGEEYGTERTKWLIKKVLDECCLETSWWLKVFSWVWRT